MAISVAARRSGRHLVDERTGLIHGGPRSCAADSEILASHGQRAGERNTPWNAVAVAERRKDARQRQHLAQLFAAKLAERYSLAVGMCHGSCRRDFPRLGKRPHLTTPEPANEGDGRNDVAHCLTTTRQVLTVPDGALALGDKAAIGLSGCSRRALCLGRVAEEIRYVRMLWRNLAVAQAGGPERIDALSHQARGIEREAAPHLGAAAVHMERRGTATDRGDAVRQAAANNREREQLRQPRAALKAQQC